MGKDRHVDVGWKRIKLQKEKNIPGDNTRYVAIVEDEHDHRFDDIFTAGSPAELAYLLSKNTNILASNYLSLATDIPVIEPNGKCSFQFTENEMEAFYKALKKLE